jgi:branched-chain amino acid transport system ATP-binding protein
VITGVRAEQRVKKGLVRTHQINTLLMEHTTRDNVAIAVAERRGFAWRALRYGPQWRACLEEAHDCLAGLGIAEAGDRRVSELPYGQQRLLEIAIGLALKPKVLLLDEPGAGIPSTESHIIDEALDRLPQDIAILLIEHDMDLVFRFARDITVLVQGAVLTSGAPAEIARNPQVRAVYLGRSQQVGARRWRSGISWLDMAPPSFWMGSVLTCRKKARWPSSAAMAWARPPC